MNGYDAWRTETPEDEADRLRQHHRGLREEYPESGVCVDCRAETVHSMGGVGHLCLRCRMRRLEKLMSASSVAEREP